MKTIYELQQIAARLRQITEVNSISPEDTFGLQYDVLEYLADMEQNADGLGIRKVYKSTAAMEADGTAPVGSNGKPLRFGQLVMVFDMKNPTQEENGNIYAWQKGDSLSPWLLMGNLCRIRSNMEVENLHVLNRLYAHEIEVLRKAYTEGNLSLCNVVATIERVVPVHLDGKITTASIFVVPIRQNGEITGYSVITAARSGSGYRLIADTECRDRSIYTGDDIIGYKCYWPLDSSKKNGWRVGDMAQFRRSDIEAGSIQDVADRYYWRLVIETGTEILAGKTYGYVILSNVVSLVHYKDGDGFSHIGPNKGAVLSGRMYHKGDVVHGVENHAGKCYAGNSGIGSEVTWLDTDPSFELQPVYGYADGSDIPAAGDEIAQVGSPIDARRQGMITMDVSDWSENNPAACKIDVYRAIGANTSSRSAQYTMTKSNRPIRVSPEDFQLHVDSLDIRARRGAISVPYTRITQTNYNSMVDAYGEINLSETGSYVQVEFQPDGLAGYHPGIVLPSVAECDEDSRIIGFELMLLNLSKDADSNTQRLNLGEVCYYDGTQFTSDDMVMEYGEEYRFKVFFFDGGGKWLLTGKNHY